MTATAAASRSSAATPRLRAVVTAPTPSGLVRTSASPGRRAGVGDQLAPGATVPVTARPYLGSGSSIEWPPTIWRAGRVDDVGAAAEDLAQHVAAEALERERDDVQRRQRRAAHRVDVRQRVGRGDAAEVVGVVDDRGEEVDRLDQREVVARAGRRPRRRRWRSRRAGAVVAGPAGRPRTIGSRSAAASLQPQPAPWLSEVRGTSRAMAGAPYPRAWRRSTRRSSGSRRVTRAASKCSRSAWANCREVARSSRSCGEGDGAVAGDQRLHPRAHGGDRRRRARSGRGRGARRGPRRGARRSAAPRRRAAPGWAARGRRPAGARRARAPRES